ncbi:TIGR04211 family SH3 domain-containing protein [Spongiibacter sp.]|uniref:TIGR04211 family SH3 domain-containing protein n=1 Tax=Spongiibacter sp. TaxID=2024860 RepID=UPI0035633C3D
MKNPMLLGLLTALLTLSGTAFAETRYISDKVYVPLRVGDGSKYRIVHRGLPSGTKLELLETNEDSGYSKVKTSSGTEGWLPSHYLIDAPVARTRLRETEAKLQKLSESNKALREQLNNTTQSSEKTASIVEQLERENSALSEELDAIKRISANAIKLDSDNRRLLESNQMLSSELDVLKTDNARLRENQENEFYLNGAFAVLIGVMIALIVPRMTPKRRSEWV